MFSRYYQAELAFLRSMGREYALANPSTAGLLAERGSDPDVERLLEGFAFLAARVRERVEDGVPELVHALAEILVPHSLRPVPACSIVEFTPVPGAVRGRVRVPRDTEVASVPVDGTSCRFRTCADLDLLPLAVQEVVLDRSHGAAPALRVQLQAAAPALPSVFRKEGIRLFVHGEPPLATTLLLWIAAHLREVEVRGLGPGARTTRLPPGSARAVGFDPDLALLPWPRFAPEGYRAVGELFAFPQKLLFFEVANLDAAADAAQERFELVLRFDRPPELPAAPSRESLKVNCAPVVNLFPSAADPVSVRAPAEEHLVRAADLPPRHMEIHDVVSVLGVPEGPGERRPYEPFSAFAHGARGGDARYFQLRRTLSPVDGGLDTYVAVSRPADAAGWPEPEVLSIQVTATNRALPGALRPGDVSQPTATSPTVARFRNIVPVTRPVRPPVGSELHWRLLAHLAANRAGVGSAEALRALLDVYNFGLLADGQGGRANRVRVEGIRDVSARPARRLVAGAPVRGTHVALSLDEERYAGVGDAWLFAAAVAELLGARAALNAFSELTLRLEPSGREYRFPPRSGRRTLA
jgi:type VI secretion system protein ImpG